VSPHGMLDPWALAVSSWKKKLAGAAFQNAHLHDAKCLHALCASEAESIRAYGLTNPICVIPNGIALPGPERHDAPWSGQIPDSAKVLLYLGRLHPKKGLPNLIRAWAAVSDPDWHLVIAGWDQGAHERELQTLAREVRASGIHFIGPQFNAAKSAAYQNADAFILPSLSEGLPMVILEAWAYGKPVLMTNACNLPEGFEHRAALRITAEVEGIAQGLRGLMDLPPEELSATGARGRSLVEQRFSWPKVAADLRTVYEWILQRGPRPECVRPEP
jgi:glycosyltransferase involved in cell wall biosynthesis